LLLCFTPLAPTSALRIDGQYNARSGDQIAKVLEYNDIVEQVMHDGTSSYQRTPGYGYHDEITSSCFKENDATPSATVRNSVSTAGPAAALT